MNARVAASPGSPGRSSESSSHQEALLVLLVIRKLAGVRLSQASSIFVIKQSRCIESSIVAASESVSSASMRALDRVARHRPILLLRAAMHRNDLRGRSPTIACSCRAHVVLRAHFAYVRPAPPS
jgi:hypothetical protein